MMMTSPSEREGEGERERSKKIFEEAILLASSTQKERVKVKREINQKICEMMR